MTIVERVMTSKRIEEEHYNELKSLITEKYDQANKDIYDFKDTIDILKKQQQVNENKINNLKKVFVGMNLLMILFIWKKK